MASDTRVCPYCGEPPGSGVFCEACGRNLSAVERLPTRAEWEAGGAATAIAEVPASDPADLAQRCAEATEAFLAAMREAGNPGLTDHLLSTKFSLRPKKLRGWVVRPVDREDFEQPKHYFPGLVLTPEGRYHQLDSELHGHGQRDFPQYWHKVTQEPIEMPLEQRLVGELDALREEIAKR